jgi:hypothetical protein
MYSTVLDQNRIAAPYPVTQKPSARDCLGCCCCLSTTLCFYLLIFGGLLVTTYDGFGLEAHTGIIVGSYVTASDTPPPGSRGMIGEQSTSWSKKVAENSVIGPQVVYQKPETIYYVTAIVTYPRGVEHNVTYYNNCSLTLQGYPKYSSAKGNLKHVPFGKQKSVHLSKRHHGRYCIDTPDFVYSRDVGLPLLLTGCGLLSLMFASICVVGCKDEQRTASTTVETAIAADTSPVPPNRSYDGVELTHPHGAAGRGPVVSGDVGGNGDSVRVSGRRPGKNQVAKFSTPPTAAVVEAAVEAEQC